MRNLLNKVKSPFVKLSAVVTAASISLFTPVFALDSVLADIQSDAMNTASKLTPWGIAIVGIALGAMIAMTLMSKVGNRAVKS